MVTRIDRMVGARFRRAAPRGSSLIGVRKLLCSKEILPQGSKSSQLRCQPKSGHPSLSVDGLASSRARPEAFIGLHFFNPVPASDLVEIVVGSKPFDDLVKRAQGGSNSSARQPSP